MNWKRAKLANQLETSIKRHDDIRQKLESAIARYELEHGPEDEVELEDANGKRFTIKVRHLATLIPR